MHPRAPHLLPQRREDGAKPCDGHLEPNGLAEELPDALRLDQAALQLSADALGFVDQNGGMAEVVVEASFNLVEPTHDGIQTNISHGGRVVRRG
jgi:hypothetical protein